MNLAELAMGAPISRPMVFPGTHGTWSAPLESPAAVLVWRWPPTFVQPHWARTPAGLAEGPAAYCGVVGLRPTFTLVSRYGVTPLRWYMDTAAPMTKTVVDCALLLGAIAGYDPSDPYSSRRPIPDYTAHLRDGIAGVRIGLIRELQESDDINPEVNPAIEKALEVFRELGAEVSEVSIPLISLAGAIFVGIADTEGAGAQDEILRTRPMNLDPATRTRLQSGVLVPSKVYNRAMKARVQIRQQFMAALEQVDVLVAATSPYPAPKHTDLTAPIHTTEQVRSRFFFRRSYSACYALASLPAISIPGGFTSSNLPIGLQLGGRPFAEETLLRVAHAYEQATPWHTIRAPELEL